MDVFRNRIECNDKVLAQFKVESYFKKDGTHYKTIFYVDCLFRHTHKILNLKTESSETALAVWNDVVNG